MRPKQWLILLFFLLLLAYSLFQARFLIIGPYIRISTPKNGEVATSTLIYVSGAAKNAAWLSMNGRQIFTNEEGHFSEKLVLAPGTSIITLMARDRFSRVSEKSVLVVYKEIQQFNETEEESATSTRE